MKINGKHVKWDTIKVDPIELVIRYGSGFRGGEERINDFFSEDHTLKDKASFLKNEYGIGGFGTPVKEPNRLTEMMTDGKGIIYSYCDHFGLLHKDKSITWNELAKRIQSLVDKGEYI